MELCHVTVEPNILATSSPNPNEHQIHPIPTQFIALLTTKHCNICLPHSSL